MHNIRIVSNRLYSHDLVRGFRFCDLNSPDLSRRRRARFVPMGAISIGVEFIPSVAVAVAPTNLIQSGVEVLLRSPFNVWGNLLVTSNVDRVQ